MADSGPVIDRWGNVSRQGHQIFADEPVQFAAEVDEPRISAIARRVVVPVAVAVYGRTGVARGSLRRWRHARHQDGVR